MQSDNCTSVNITSYKTCHHPFQYLAVQCTVNTGVYRVYRLYKLYRQMLYLFRTQHQAGGGAVVSPAQPSQHSLVRS